MAESKADLHSQSVWSVNEQSSIAGGWSWLKYSITQLFHLKSDRAEPAQRLNDSCSSSSKTEETSPHKSDLPLNEVKKLLKTSGQSVGKVAELSLASEKKGKPMASKKSTSKSPSKTISQKKTKGKSTSSVAPVATPIEDTDSQLHTVGNVRGSLCPKSSESTAEDSSEEIRISMAISNS